jgi:hypothetical protein
MFRIPILNRKLLSKAFGLFAFSCVLLVSGLVGLQQTPVAHAAVLPAAGMTIPGPLHICQPPNCNQFPFHDLYVHSSSEVWGYNGASSDVIDDNQIGLTKGNQVSGQFGGIVAVLARGNKVYEVRKELVGGAAQEFVFAVVYGGCATTTGYCLTELDDTSGIFFIAAGTVGLYEIRAASVWQLTGLCLGCWTQIDQTNTLLQQGLYLVAGSRPYELRADGTVWRYNGTPYYWTEVDNNQTVSGLSIDSHNVLYELRQVADDNGQLVSSSVLQGHGPFNFQPIDTAHLTKSIVADRRLYQWDDDGTILIYQGQPGNWADAYFSPTIQDVEAGAASDAVYWEPSDHSIWQYTPATGSSSAIRGPAPDQSIQMARQQTQLGGLL